MVAKIETLITKAQKLLQQSQHTVALTGAGISTPSGIPDFRSPTSGIWNHVNPMEVASIYAFRQHPQRFYDWLHPVSQTILDAKPNAAHYALVDLETHGPLQSIITQNIDLLHSKAGSQRVYEVHGHLREATCLDCHTHVAAQPLLQTFIQTGQAPQCPQCQGILKPDVILFGELLPMNIYQAAQQEAQNCDLMLVAGSALEVAPAGDLPLLSKQNGAKLIIVNFGNTHADVWADVVIHADVVDVLPRLATIFAN